MPIVLTALPGGSGDSWKVNIVINGSGYTGTATRATPSDHWIVAGLAPISLLGLPLSPALPEGYVAHVSSAEMDSAVGPAT